MTKAVRHIFRHTWRASSLVEGINSVFACISLGIAS